MLCVYLCKCTQGGKEVEESGREEGRGRINCTNLKVSFSLIRG